MRYLKWILFILIVPLVFEIVRYFHIDDFLANIPGWVAAILFFIMLAFGDHLIEK